jgi:hypothetical protein
MYVYTYNRLTFLLMFRLTAGDYTAALSNQAGNVNTETLRTLKPEDLE